MTTPLFNHGWEKRLHEELKKLTELDAPGSLIPNVLDAIRTRQEMAARAWWRRPATTWHPAARMAFAVAAVGVLGALLVGAHLLWPEVQASSGMDALSAISAKLSAVWSAGHTVADAIGLALQAVFTPLRLAILGLIIFSQVALFGAGSAAMRAMLQPSRVLGT